MNGLRFGFTRGVIEEWAHHDEDWFELVGSKKGRCSSSSGRVTGQQIAGSGSFYTQSNYSLLLVLPPFPIVHTVDGLHTGVYNGCVRLCVRRVPPLRKQNVSKLRPAASARSNSRSRRCSPPHSSQWPIRTLSQLHI